MFLRIFGILLISGGLLTAGYNGYHWWKESHIVQTYDRKAYARSMGTGQPLKPLDQGIEYGEKPPIGEGVGDLIIPRLDAKLPLIEGIADPQLSQGVGHYPDTAFPGETGHSVLAGHRETTFKRIGEMKKGDLLIIKNGEGTFTYKVRKMWVTDKNDRTVIVPKDKPVLSLITCYPFDMIGRAPERYIVQADLVEIQEKK
ncbi:class D sortase [Paludifilum halophilum]|uniref:Class D sortase n=1 Tax=Paludifilum halophilum TaxID=1642702 RepID=A0A235B2S6_9BACL|nr:class D sortase [Paludifilum halophilum]OYD06584.1 hypothetical protein CHM34_15950 [Paludifilum halophilum]